MYVPSFDKRLQDRYEQLVQEHTGPRQSVAAGLRALPGTADAFASTQAAWRFFHNPGITLSGLAQPLLDHARRVAPQACQRYALVIHDWSVLSFPTQRRKQDRAFLGQDEELGYELASAVLISDGDGSPIAPLAARLLAADGQHDSRYPVLQKPQPRATHLDQVAGTMSFLAELHLPRPIVHIIDCEADSVFHLRVWTGRKRRFVVRVENRIVHYRGRRCKVQAVVDALARRGKFQDNGRVLYHGKSARQEVAETTVTLQEPAYRERKQADGTIRKRRIPGRALKVRLIVSRIYDEAGLLKAQWLLLSNVPKDVTTATVALWYYWRWQIESFFKLLKSAGHELEHWQQRTAAAVARRLLVASMACVLVWQLGRDPSPTARTARRLLVRLSGRQMAYGRESTDEALLAGLWVLLAVAEVQQQYTPEELRQLTDLVLGRHDPGIV